MEAGWNASFEYCYSEQIGVTLFAEYGGTAPYSITYVVNTDDPVTVTGLSAGSTIIAPQLYAPGVYNIAVTNITDSEGCQASAAFLANCTATVTVNEEPLVSFGFNGVEAGWNASFEYCYNELIGVTLFAEYGGTAPYSITYTVNSEPSVTVTGLSAGSTIIAPQLYAPGVYNIVVTNITDSEGCQASTTFLGYCNATVTVNPAPVVSDVTLLADVGAAPSTWTWPVGGSFNQFDICVDPLVVNPSYFFLDIDELTANVALKSSFLNPFTLDQTSLPTGWLDYWADKGVDGTSTNSDDWQYWMWPIINGNAPIFYIYLDGTDYRLIDGLTYQSTGTIEPLKISGDYPEWSYQYTGTVTSADDCVSSFFDVFVEINTIPIFEIVFDNPQPVCGGSEVEFSVAVPAGGSFTYAWEFGDATPSGPTNGSTAKAIAPAGCTGTFTATCTVTDADGDNCSRTESVTVTVGDLTPPEIISPATIRVNNDPGTCGAIISYDVFLDPGTDPFDGIIDDNCTYAGNGPADFPGTDVRIRKLVIRETGTDLAIPDLEPGVPEEMVFSVESFFDVFTDPGIPPQGGWDPVTAQGTMKIEITLTGENSDTRFFSTEMTELTLQGGSLPGGIIFRIDQAQNSTGKFSSKNSGGGYQVESFFDVFLEVSPDNGTNWYPASAPLHIGRFSNPTDPAVPTVIYYDNCGTTAPVQTSGLISGSQFPVGLTLNTFTVTDACGNASETSFEVIVTDAEKPVITLIGATPAYVCQWSGYTDAGATASDNCDGDMTADIVVTGTVDTDVPGTYILSYDVTDEAGNIAITATREVIVRPEPALGFAFNGQIAGTNSIFEYCYDDIVTVTLGEIWAGTPPFNIEWTVNSTPASATGVLLNDILFSSSLTPGTYVVQITSIIDANGCSPLNYSPYVASAVVHPMPQAQISLNGNILPPVINATTQLCYSDQLILTLTDIQQGTGPLTFTYTLNGVPQTPVSVNEGEVIFYQASPLTPGTYAVVMTSLTDAEGCEVSTAVLPYYNHTFIVNPAPVVSNVTLLADVGAAPSTWTWPVGGSFNQFDICVDPLVVNPSYFFLDIDELTANVALKSSFLNPFTLDQTSLPTGWLDYWADKGVDGTSTNSDDWQYWMWPIINGNAPIFYIYLDGTDYRLIDGLTYQSTGTIEPLKISGDYPEWNYKYTGTVTSADDCVSSFFDVFLEIKSLPVIICPGNISVNNDPGECGAEVGFSITVDGVSVSFSQYFPVGTTIVTATTQNDCGPVSCEFNVTVTDTEPPTFTAPQNITIYRNANCSYDASVAVTGDVTDESDNCFPLEATYADLIDDSNPCATIITRTWSLFDINGNEADDQVQIITVIDNTPPTITQGTIAGCYASVAEAEAAAIAATAYYDNCAAVSALVVMAVTTGTYNVTITVSVTDPCGNSSSVNYNTIVNPVMLVADFTADDLTPAKFTTVQFTSLSTGDPTAYSWSITPNTVLFVDGTDAGSPNPKVQFTNGGLYTIALTVTNDCYGDTETKVGYIRAGVHGLWIGTSSKEWNTASNWDDLLTPDGLTDVMITTETGPDFWPKFTGNLLVGNDPASHCRSIMFGGDGYLLTVKGILKTVANGANNSIQVIPGANGRIRFEAP